MDGFDLKGEDLEFLWIPEGFAHGFVVLSETANVLYKTTGSTTAKANVAFDGMILPWRLIGRSMSIGEPTVSAKDAVGACFTKQTYPPLTQAANIDS